MIHNHPVSFAILYILGSVLAFLLNKVCMKKHNPPYNMGDVWFGLYASLFTWAAVGVYIVVYFVGFVEFPDNENE